MSVSVWLAFAACAGTDPELFFPLINEPEDWQDRALCAEVDPDLWFPEKGGSTRQAKAVCAGCEVREECLAFALEHSGPEDVGSWGIWGGLSAPERHALLAERGQSQPVAEGQPSGQCRKGHFRTPQNTRVDPDAVRCMDCERARYLAKVA